MEVSHRRTFSTLQIIYKQLAFAYKATQLFDDFKMFVFGRGLCVCARVPFGFVCLSSATRYWCVIIKSDLFASLQYLTVFRLFGWRTRIYALLFSWAEYLMSFSVFSSNDLYISKMQIGFIQFSEVLFFCLFLFRVENVLKSIARGISQWIWFCCRANNAAERL